MVTAEGHCCRHVDEIWREQGGRVHFFPVLLIFPTIFVFFFVLPPPIFSISAGSFFDLEILRIFGRFFLSDQILSIYAFLG